MQLINNPLVQRLKVKKNKKMQRKFGTNLQNKIKDKSNNHIVLKSRAFSFDGKSKAPPHITRKYTDAGEKPPLVVNKTIKQPVLIIEKPLNQLNNIQNDQQIVPVYLKDCIRHMRNKQKNNNQFLQLIKNKNPQYMNTRGTIIQELYNINFELNLSPKILFIAVSYMDQFCSKQTLQKNQFYLFGITCLLLATKFQHNYLAPNILAIQQISPYYLSRQQIIEMEYRMLQVLNFSLIVDTPIKYLQLYSKMMNFQDKIFYTVQYILQLTLVQINFKQFSYSILGASAVYLVNKIKKISPAWPSQFKQLSGYDQSDLRPCAKQLCCLLQKSHQIPNATHIRAKFSSERFCKASSIRVSLYPNNS